MKRFVTLFLSVFILIYSADAQINTTPEVPKNYKPKPKELLPMPDSLNDEKIFPVLGTYNVKNNKGDSLQINITKDTVNKGLVWIDGLPQGKMKAWLRESPTTYKIPQQTIKNKTVTGGTLFLDAENNTIYLNIGNSYNEKQPLSVFANQFTINNNGTDNATDKKLKTSVKGISYSGIKIY